MLKWGAVQDGTSFPQFNHGETIGNLEVAFAICRKTTKKQKLKSITLYSIAFLQEK